MNRIIIACLVLLSAAAWAASVPSPETPAIITNNSGGDTRTTPLPVALSSASISIPTVTGGITSASTLDLVGSTTSQLIAALSGRTTIAVFNISTSTVYLSVGAGTATAGYGIPLYSGGYFSAPIDDSVAVNYISAVPAAISVFQGGQ